MQGKVTEAKRKFVVVRDSCSGDAIFSESYISGALILQVDTGSISLFIYVEIPYKRRGLGLLPVSTILFWPRFTHF
jgi:hypothetical protein